MSVDLQDDTNSLDQKDDDDGSEDDSDDRNDLMLKDPERLKAFNVSHLEELSNTNLEIDLDLMTYTFVLPDVCPSFCRRKLGPNDPDLEAAKRENPGHH
jgi:hypothetical protein